MIFFAKKGLSPLIATVLLIAFAVSLGAVIMNIGVSMTHTVCDPIQIQLIPQDTAQVCYTDNELVFTIQNTGTPIQGFQVLITDSERIPNDFLLALDQMQTHTQRINITHVSDRISLTITPITREDSRLTYCPNKQIEINTLSRC